MVKVEIGFRVLFEKESYLRPCLEESLETIALAAPAETCEDRYLHVVHRTLELLGNSRLIVDDGLIVFGEYALLPTYLGIVDLSYNRTNAVEVFLGGVAEGQTAGESGVHALGNLGFVADAVEHVAAIDAYGQLAAMLAYLCMRNEEGEQ